MITHSQYFLNPNTGEIKAHDLDCDEACIGLLGKVNAMLQHLKWGYPIDKDTGCSISGSKGGTGGGGFRLSWESGAPSSKHKTGHAVDVFDPKNELDGMLTDEILEQFGLYREHPDDTPGWCHLQDVSPKSGRRTFKP